MYTIVETPLFERLVDDYWTADERVQFCVWLANNPERGDVIPGSGGCRKVRYAHQGTGKRGGVRVIYYNHLAHDQIWLLMIYAKSERENIPAHILKAIKDTIDHAQALQRTH